MTFFALTDGGMHGTRGLGQRVSSLLRICISDILSVSIPSYLCLDLCHLYPSYDYPSFPSSSVATLPYLPTTEISTFTPYFRLPSRHTPLSSYPPHTLFPPPLLRFCLASTAYAVDGLLQGTYPSVRQYIISLGPCMETVLGRMTTSRSLWTFPW